MDTHNSMQRIVVSGGNGYIGSSLVKRLVDQGAEVHALVNRNHQRLDALLPSENIHVLKHATANVGDIVLRIQPDAIFHLAAVYSEPVSLQCVLSMIEGNLTLGACMLFAAAQCQRPPIFVNTGTYWQFSEDGSFSPNSFYAATKQAFQDLLQFYRDRFNIRSTTLVLYDTFGHGDNRGKLWERLISSRPGTHIPLTDGSQYVQALHIDDTVDAFIHAAELLQRGEELAPLYAVRFEESMPLRDLVDRFNAASGLKLKLGWGESKHWEGQVFNPWLGETLFGWRPQVDTLEALLDLARLHHAPTEDSE